MSSIINHVSPSTMSWHLNSLSLDSDTPIALARKTYRSPNCTAFDVLFHRFYPLISFISGWNKARRSFILRCWVTSFWFHIVDRRPFPEHQLHSLTKHYLTPIKKKRQLTYYKGPIPPYWSRKDNQCLYRVASFTNPLPYSPKQVVSKKRTLQSKKVIDLINKVTPQMIATLDQKRRHILLAPLLLLSKKSPFVEKC